jgi:hypothetical protein
LEWGTISRFHQRQEFHGVLYGETSGNKRSLFKFRPNISMKLGLYSGAGVSFTIGVCGHSMIFAALMNAVNSVSCTILTFYRRTRLDCDSSQTSFWRFLHKVLKLQ